MQKEVAKKKPKSKNLTAKYSLLLKPEVRKKLDEIQAFTDIDVPESIRGLIEEFLQKVG